nr:retrotransposon Orf1 [Tanacetum cinerariifolium]
MLLIMPKTPGTHDGEVRSTRSKRPRQHETVEEVSLPQVHHEFFLWEGCSRDAKSRVHEAESDEEIFTSVAWIRAFNINEPIFVELCHEFYSTYKFDEVCADDELQPKKIIKFRLGRRAYSLTLLEFARRLGLYLAIELEEDGFNVYFERGLRNDDNFNAQDYWLSISQDDNLGLSRSHPSTIRNPILRVIHKMITYGLCQRTTGYDKVQKNVLWLLSMFDARHQNGYANVAWIITGWMKRKGFGTQKESQICCGQFILKLARKCRVLTEDMVRSLSALIYCRDFDSTTLRDLIDSEGKVIPEDPQLGVPRVGIHMPSRASMHDLYDRMGGMEIRQDGAYNPPGYAQPQYDQYYQQYPPPPPQYRHQHDDDE